MDLFIIFVSFIFLRLVLFCVTYIGRPSDRAIGLNTAPLQLAFVFFLFLFCFSVTIKSQ
jgi:hypothetical protein